MSTQLKEPQPLVTEAVIKTLYMGNEPMFDIGGSSPILTYRRPGIDSEGRASFEHGDIVQCLFKKDRGIGEYYSPEFRLEVFEPGVEPWHYFILEYEAENNRHVLINFNHRETIRQEIGTFSSPALFQRILHSDGVLYIYGADEDYSTFELWAADLETNKIKKLGTYQSTHRVSTAAYGGEIFLSGREGIYRQSPLMEKPALFCKTAGEIFDMAIVEGNLLYLGELSDGQRGLCEINPKTGKKIRTIPMEHVDPNFRLVVRDSDVFIYQHYQEFPQQTDGKMRSLPRIDYLDKSGRAYPVAAVEVGNIDSLHIGDEAVYWCEVVRRPLRTMIRWLALEDLPAAEIVDPEKLRSPLPFADEEVQEVFQDDYCKRQVAYDRLFSPIDDQVSALVSLNEKCPGISIMYAKPEKLPYPKMAFTFGLAGALAAREFDRRRFPGYGFEFVAATTVFGDWLSELLNYLTTDHTNGEFDYFLEVTEKGGVFLGPLTDEFGLFGEATTYFIAPAWGSMPREVDVGYGKISFLNVINVTEAEIRYAKTSGGADALLEKFREAIVEPIIDPARKGVV